MVNLNWFEDSPDAGDPACICSVCGKQIPDDGYPVIRIWNDADQEARFCREHAAKIVGIRATGFQVTENFEEN